MIQYIPKEELIHGKYYKGHCRNATVARWDDNRQRFFYWRQKFLDRWVESIDCPGDDTGFDLFYPTNVLENPKEEIPLD